MTISDATFCNPARESRKIHGRDVTLVPLLLSGFREAPESIGRTSLRAVSAAGSVVSPTPRFLAYIRPERYI